MKKTIYPVLVMALATILSLSAKAQNLVPNPSFEDTIACPKASGMNNSVKGWSAYRNSPDYFNSCADSASLASVPYNVAGYQYAHTGNGYAGIQCYFTPEAREYFGRQLSQPLVIGQKYFVSFYVSCAFGGIAGTHGGSNKTGVLFSTVPYTFLSPAPIKNFAHIYSDSIILDTLNWVQIKGSFIADSNYNYIIIGNFFDDAHTDTVQYLGGVRAYYYVDDVCVTIDSNGCFLDAIKEPNEVSQVFVFPNPAYDQITTIGKKIQSIEMIDLIGHSCFKKAISLSAFQTIIDVRELRRGIYIMKINTLNKSIVKRIILN